MVNTVDGDQNGEMEVIQYGDVEVSVDDTKDGYEASGYEARPLGPVDEAERVKMVAEAKVLEQASFVSKAKYDEAADPLAKNEIVLGKNRGKGPGRSRGRGISKELAMEIEATNDLETLTTPKPEEGTTTPDPLCWESIHNDTGEPVNVWWKSPFHGHFEYRDGEQMLNPGSKTKPVPFPLGFKHRLCVEYVAEATAHEDYTVRCNVGRSPLQTGMSVRIPVSWIIGKDVLIPYNEVRSVDKTEWWKDLKGVADVDDVDDVADVAKASKDMEQELGQHPALQHKKAEDPSDEQLWSVLELRGNCVEHFVPGVFALILFAPPLVCLNQTRAFQKPPGILQQPLMYC